MKALKHCPSSQNCHCLLTLIQCCFTGRSVPLSARAWPRCKVWSTNLNNREQEIFFCLACRGSRFLLSLVIRYG